MKNQYITYLGVIALTCILVFSYSCKKKTEDAPVETEAPKVLNKATISPKKWYSEGSAFIHDLKTNGNYGVSGTWHWKNDSDTMEIVTQSGFPPTYWKVYWNTDSLMNCEKIGTFSPFIYKLKPW
jgi:hypothetical protein